MLSTIANNMGLLYSLLTFPLCLNTESGLDKLHHKEQYHFKALVHNCSLMCSRCYVYLLVGERWESSSGVMEKLRIAAHAQCGNTVLGSRE